MQLWTRALRIVVAGSLVIGTGVALGEAPPKPGKERETDGNPKCLSWHGEARYGAYGYDHLVELENACDRALSCSVKTDVNPEPIDVRIGPQEKTTVLTFRGSPAREFKAEVRCRPSS